MLSYLFKTHNWLMKTFLMLLLACNVYNSQAQLSNTTALTDDERQYGLAQIWSAARYNFVYFDQLKYDWDSLYKATIPKVRQAKNDRAYYDVLRWFAAQLNDGHTNVWYPMSYYNPKAMYPVIKTDKIEGRVFITGVYNDTLALQGIEKGMEILKINGMHVIDYANTYVAPYEHGSTPQGKEMITYRYDLLAGPLDEPLHLILKNKKGQVKEVAVSRRLERKDPPVVQFTTVGKNVGLLTIEHFGSPTFNKQFDSIYPAILKTDALIIDVRENGGGDGAQGHYILKHLTKQPFLDAASSAIQYNPLLKSWGLQQTPFFQLPADSKAPFTDRAIYQKPVVLLISKGSNSATEDFAMAFDYMKRGTLIGEPTAGSTGQPMQFKLPGGATFRVCIKKDTYPDGKQFVGVGIQPAITIKPTASGYLKGEDAVLQKAVEVLK
jgi:carboxyl-terminal processing protease